MKGVRVSFEVAPVTKVALLTTLDLLGGVRVEIVGARFETGVRETGHEPDHRFVWLRINMDT